MKIIIQKKCPSDISEHYEKEEILNIPEKKKCIVFLQKILNVECHFSVTLNIEEREGREWSNAFQFLMENNFQNLFL